MMPYYGAPFFPYPMPMEFQQAAQAAAANGYFGPQFLMAGMQQQQPSMKKRKKSGKHSENEEMTDDVLDALVSLQKLRGGQQAGGKNSPNTKNGGQQVGKNLEQLERQAMAAEDEGEPTSKRARKQSGGEKEQENVNTEDGEHEDKENQGDKDNQKEQEGKILSEQNGKGIPPAYEGGNDTQAKPADAKTVEI